MKKNWRKSVVLLGAALGGAAVLAGCSGKPTPSGTAPDADTAVTAAESAATVSSAQAAAQKAAAEAKVAQSEARKAAKNADLQAVNGTIVVSGYDWGPGVDKVLIKLPTAVEDADAEDAIMNTNATDRRVKAVYLSDERGNKVTTPSNTVTVELKTTYENSGSPFTYDFMDTMHNQWVKKYEVDGVVHITRDGNEETLGISRNLIHSYVSFDTELFNFRDAFSGEYENPMTKKKEKVTLQRAAYAPDSLIADGAKNPLIIWLHGQGEGGTDPEIALLGNQVTALAKSPIQDYFTTDDGVNGAYVLAVQCPTYWMDGGDGKNSAGDVHSRYTQALMDAIRDYVTKNGDVDESRIYLGGCSNGGYMTMEMLVNDPDYFAAAYPVCEAYAFHTFRKDENGSYVTKSTGNAMSGIVSYVPTKKRYLTEEQIESISDIPIWFVAADNDPIVNPRQYVLPTVQSLLQAGDRSCFLSYFEDVRSVDHPEVKYLGHWSWTYLLGDAVKNVQSTSSIRYADEKDRDFGTEPSNDGGGAYRASDRYGSYESIFAWMNAQHRTDMQ